MRRASGRRREKIGRASWGSGFSPSGEKSVRPGWRPARATRWWFSCTRSLSAAGAGLVGQQGVEEEDLEEAQGVERDAVRGERVVVEDADLGVLDAVALHGVEVRLAFAHAAFEADGGVELVFQLEHAVVDLEWRFAVGGAQVRETFARGG